MGCNRCIQSFIAHSIIARLLIANSVSLREMFRNALVLKTFDNYQ